MVVTGTLLRQVCKDPLQSGRLHQGTVSLSFPLDKVEGAAVLGTADFLPLPPCGCSLEYSSPLLTLGSFLFILHSVNCGVKNFAWKTPEANLGFRSRATLSGKMTSPSWDTNHLLCNASILLRQPASISGNVRTRPQPLYSSSCVLRLRSSDPAAEYWQRIPEK